MSDIYTANKEPLSAIGEQDSFVVEQDEKLRLITKAEAALGEKGVIAAWLNDHGELLLQLGGKEN